MIFVIQGKSATGKDTIYNELMKKYSIFNRIVLYTTRPMRKGETDGIEYNFSTQEEFEELKNKGLVIESRTYNTKQGLWTYFTVNENIDPNLTYLTIGTLESFSKLRYYFKNQIKVIPIYIWLEDHERLLRAIRREEQQDNPDYLELCRRYLADAQDFSIENIDSISEYDYFITYKNDQSVEKGAEFIFNLIKNKLSEKDLFDSEVTSL